VYAQYAAAHVQALGDELSLRVVVRRTDNTVKPAPVPMHRLWRGPYRHGGHHQETWFRT